MWRRWELVFGALLLASYWDGTRGQDADPSPGTAATPGPPVPVPQPDGPQAFPEPEKANLPMFTMDYGRIQIPFEFTLWVLLASFAKIGFHVYHKITIWIPESCLLIVIGLVVGGIMHAVKEEPPAVLDSNVFFLYMLPPIVLENGYFMPARPFFENTGTVLWYAVVGTLWNSVGIGLSLYAVCQVEVFGVQDINLQENLLFASIISAVDPVAVISVFEDISVNEQLFIVVFGEGLFNDAVTVVLYNMFTFVADMPVVESSDVFLAMARFFVVGLGGLLFGLLFGVAGAFTSRFTNNVRSIEPLFVFMYTYLAYLVAELFAISSIMAIVVCAITMKSYLEENVSQGSCTTIRHVVKMLACISETLIFFFLGVVTVTTDHEWNWAYVLFTLLFAFVWRGLGVLVLTQIINPFRTIPFNFKDQFGLAYGGLRGAICFALVFTLPDTINRRSLFVTASIAIIIFTVFIQGISIRPLVEYINIRRTNNKHQTINEEIHTRLMEHTISGLQDLCGQWSHYYWKDKFMKFNERVLRRILIRDNRAESSIVALYKKLELQNAIELLDTPLGDLSAAPSLVSLTDEKKASSRPKRTFLMGDVKKMRDNLSKNLYKINQRTTAWTNKDGLHENRQAREILMRRHHTIRRSVRMGSFRDQSIPKSQRYYSLQPGMNLESALPLRRTSHGSDIVEMKEGRLRAVQPPPSVRSSSRSFTGRLGTVKEATPRPPSPGLDVIDESPVSSRGPRAKGPLPTPRRSLFHRVKGGEEGDKQQQEEKEEEEELSVELQGEAGDVPQPPPLPPPPGWVPENQQSHRAGDPLIRHSSQGSRGSSRF
ncbi:Sodium/hydrogen exchanger 2 [Merluccius polli]|uniref:Sodium/hydrogen exchanger n=1 Tax=Merluccius polli TaxID=89951 RepID=A0AA47P5L5_MERPO|nr:Sodium/hydrogen exchanger 2 [Merluccius polli]